MNLLVLRCRDIETTRLFYACLGIRFESHSHGTGPVHWASESERGVLELYPASDRASVDGVGLGFAVPRLPAAREALERAGYSPGLVTVNAWGESFVLRDPDGRRVEIQQG